MKPPFYYRFAIACAKPMYRLVLSFASEKRDTVGVVTQADEFAMRYARHFPEKLAAQQATAAPCVWVHAVSLGETNTVAPIIEKLLAAGFTVVVTNTTHTGFARTQKLFAKRVNHTFIPVDAPKQITKFLAYYQPQLALFMETELWANCLSELKKRSIPSLLINARLSEKSYHGYAKFGKVSQSMMSNLSHIICQDATSKQRFEKLGANASNISLAPSLKFAVSIPNGTLAQAAALKAAWQLENRKVLVAASTHEGEEAMILAVFAVLQKQLAQAENLLLVIVPRHPERFEQVAGLIEKKGYTAYRRSAEEEITAETQVYLADSMGELFTWYALADVALVGGSFVENVGGHNPLEASILGKAVIMGQHTHKCQYVVNELLAHHAMQVVADHQALYDLLMTWLNDMTFIENTGKAGKQLMLMHQDTVAKQYALITPFLPKLPVL